MIMFVDSTRAFRLSPTALEKRVAFREKNCVGTRNV
jgi:hypothetical protein